MTEQVDSSGATGDELVRLFSALSNPHRLRILATLAHESVHVSQLARQVGLSRPLVHMHLQRLEAAGLVTGRLETSDDGKAMRFYEVAPFAIHVTPELLVLAALELDIQPTTAARKEQP